MNIVKVRNVEIGAGVPKICVPIVGITKEEIITEAKSFDSIPVDVVEWRVDWFEHVFEFDKVLDVLKELQMCIRDRYYTVYIDYFLPEAQSDDCMDVASGALFYSGSRIYPVPGVGTEFS